MKRCATCKHWRRTSVAERRSLLELYGDDRHFRKCRRIQRSIALVIGVRVSKYNMFEKSSGQPTAEAFTHGEFGCNDWTARK